MEKSFSLKDWKATDFNSDAHRRDVGKEWMTKRILGIL